MPKPAFVTYHSFQQKQTASSDLAPCILPLQQHRWATAPVSVGLRFRSASWFLGFGPCLHRETLKSGRSVHRVLLMQSTKALELACTPGALSGLWWLGSWLMHSGLMLFAILEQLRHYSCGSAAAVI